MKSALASPLPPPIANVERGRQGESWARQGVLFSFSSLAESLVPGGV